MGPRYTRSGWPFPSPEDLSNPGIESMSPVLAGGFFTTEPPGKILRKEDSKAAELRATEATGDEPRLWTMAAPDTGT